MIHAIDCAERGEDAVPVRVTRRAIGPLVRPAWSIQARTARTGHGFGDSANASRNSSPARSGRSSNQPGGRSGRRGEGRDPRRGSRRARTAADPTRSRAATALDHAARRSSSCRSGRRARPAGPQQRDLLRRRCAVDAGDALHDQHPWIPDRARMVGLAVRAGDRSGAPADPRHLRAALGERGQIQRARRRRRRHRHEVEAAGPSARTAANRTQMPSSGSVPARPMRRPPSRRRARQALDRGCNSAGPW